MVPWYIRNTKRSFNYNSRCPSKKGVLKWNWYVCIWQKMWSNLLGWFVVLCGEEIPLRDEGFALECSYPRQCQLLQLWRNNRNAIRPGWNVLRAPSPPPPPPQPCGTTAISTSLKPTDTQFHLNKSNPMNSRRSASQLLWCVFDRPQTTVSDICRQITRSVRNRLAARLTAHSCLYTI